MNWWSMSTVSIVAKVNFWVVLPGLLFLVGCGPSTMPLGHFAEWCQQPEHGLVKARQLSGFDFQLSYQPNQLVAKRNSLVPESDKALGFQNWEYYHLKIGQEGGGRQELLKELAQSPEHYQQLVGALSFSYQSNISLKVGDQTLPCLHYHFERNYGLRPELDLVFAFKNVDPQFEFDRQISIDDQLFGTGILNFQLEGTDLQTAHDIEIY